MTEADLQALFSRHGRVSHVTLVRPESGRAAEVLMPQDDEARDALRALRGMRG